MKNNPRSERGQKKKVKVISQETPPQLAVTGYDADIAFPIVGIGASAGRLAAFEGFFYGMPRSATATGMLDYELPSAEMAAHQIETFDGSYVYVHTEAQFSHSLCPECTNKLYPDFEQEEGDPQ